jgi:hypothetical protein
MTKVSIGMNKWRNNRTCAIGSQVLPVDYDYQHGKALIMVRPPIPPMHSTMNTCQSQKSELSAT